MLPNHMAPTCWNRSILYCIISNKTLEAGDAGSELEVEIPGKDGFLDGLQPLVPRADLDVREAISNREAALGKAAAIQHRKRELDMPCGRLGASARGQVS